MFALPASPAMNCAVDAMILNCCELLSCQAGTVKEGFESVSPVQCGCLSVTNDITSGPTSRAVDWIIELYTAFVNVARHLSPRPISLIGR